MLRSESVYGTDASQFNPERFLDENVAFPDFGFGYGRRCVLPRLTFVYTPQSRLKSVSWSLFR